MHIAYDTYPGQRLSLCKQATIPSLAHPSAALGLTRASGGYMTVDGDYVAPGNEIVVDAQLARGCQRNPFVLDLDYGIELDIRYLVMDEYLE